MDPQVPNVTDERTPTTPTMKQSNNLTIVSTAVFVLLALGAIVFLYYQNQQLKKMLVSYQTPVASPTPSATPDTTVDWETYVNNENGYSIKFPKSEYIRFACPSEELTATKRGTDSRTSPVTATSCERDGRYDLETKTYSTILSDPSKAEYSGYDIIGSDIEMDQVKGKLYIYTYTSNDERGPLPSWYALARVYKGNKTYEIYFGDKQKLDLFKQILSTFKFTSASPTSVPKTTPVSTSSGVPNGY